MLCHFFLLAFIVCCLAAAPSSALYLADTITSSPCITIAIGYVALLLSSNTREFAFGYLRVVYCITLTIFRLLSAFLPDDRINELNNEIRMLNDKYERDITIITSERDAAIKARKKAEDDAIENALSNTQLSSANDSLQNRLEVSERRVQQLERLTDVKRHYHNIKTLEAQVLEKDKLAKELEQTITQQNAKLKTQQTDVISKNVRHQQIAQLVKGLKHQESILKTSIKDLSQQLQHAQTVSDKKTTDNILLDTIKEAIHQLAETPGDAMTTAVGLAHTLRHGYNVDLGRLGIDARRFEAVRDYVLAGQKRNCAVLPSGFRLEGRYFPLSGLQVVGSSITEGRHVAPPAKSGPAAPTFEFTFAA
ncbi:hypothetical protein CC80DRAFT_557866 [Byssothecium circinans]|uniref:Uncharacterized protein n=1 Tax=Byssothecium circinans TaxID=147558 RepID=A0A6A5UF60_9PLEO|nr:hypothetical protein CC80DRAFT_557866 [Byssothecium circinans]